MKEKFGPEAQEDTPENREHQAEKLIEFLNKSGIAEKINSSLDDKSGFIESLSKKEAEKLLQSLNGIIIGLKMGDRSIYEFSGHVVDPEGQPIRLPPNRDAQENIFGKVVLPNIKNLKPEDVPEVLASEINLLHMFQDGNGRLGRIVYLLTKPGFKVDSSEESLATMRKYLTGREGALNFSPDILERDFAELILDSSIASKNPKILRVLGLTNIPENIPNLDLNAGREDYAGLSYSERLLMRLKFLYSVEPVDTVFGAREFLFWKYKQPNSFLVEDKENSAYAINCKKLAESIKSKEDEKMLMTAMQVAKRLRATTIVDIYQNPDKYPSRLPGVNLKTYFQQEVAKNAER